MHSSEKTKFLSDQRNITTPCLHVIDVKEAEVKTVFPYARATFIMLICLVVLCSLDIAIRFHRKTHLVDVRNLTDTLSTYIQRLWKTRDPDLIMLPSSFASCTKLYLDVGTNVGVQPRKFFEPEKYPGSAILPFFDEYFGENRKDKTNCVIGFEGNYKHVPTLQHVESTYQALGYNIKLFAPRAVYSSSWDVVTFDVDPNENSGRGFNDWGAGVAGGMLKENKAKTSVYTIDLVKILKFFKGLDFVFMKMDIEGAEYEVIRHLQESNVLCSEYLDAAVIEWHHGAQQIDFSNCKEGPTRIVPFDDESYLLDGRPLPPLSLSSAE